MADVEAAADPNNRETPQTAQDLLPEVYQELRKLAAARMAAQWDTSTLQPTALVHEAWLRLVGSHQTTWANRAHFFAAAAEAKRLDLDQVDVAIKADEGSLLLMDEALEKLAALDPQSAELVKLRFFVGMSYVEAAQALGISERTA